MTATPTLPQAHDTDVLIVGAGPTGLTLANALALRGVRTTVIDRQAAGDNTSRAAVIHARTLEVLEPLGVTPTLVARGLQAQRFTIRDRDRVLIPIGFGELPTRYPYTLMVSQAVTEQVLLERLLALGGRVLRPRTLVRLTQDADGVSATLDDGTHAACALRGRLRRHAQRGARAGAHRLQRRQLRRVVRAGRRASERRCAAARRGGAVLLAGGHGGGRAAARRRAPHRRGGRRGAGAARARPSCRRCSMRAGRSDSAPPCNEVLWGSRFRVHHRIADSYRAGRVLLAGDAAHVHSPAGGQGMNVGMLDAMSLADALQRRWRATTPRSTAMARRAGRWRNRW